MQKIISVLTRGIGAKYIFIFLIFAVCVDFWFGDVLWGVHCAWFVVFAICVLATIHVAAGVVSGDDDSLRGARSRDESIFALNFTIALAAAGGMLIVSIVSHWMNEVPFSQWRMVIKILGGIGLFVAVQLAVVNYRQASTLIAAMVLCALISALFILHEAFVNDAPWAYNLSGNQRINGLGNPIAFREQLAMVQPMALALLMCALHRGQASWHVFVLITIVVIFSVVTLLSGTRAIFVGITAGFGVVAIFFFRSYLGDAWHRAILLMAVIIPVCIFSVVTLMVLDQNPRTISISDWSAQSRIGQVRVWLHHVLDHGNPVGIAKHLPHEPSAEYVRDVLALADDEPIQWLIVGFSPHNHFIATLVYYGPMGLALLLVFYLALARSLLHSNLMVLQDRSSRSIFLVASVAGAFASIFTYWNFEVNGPFTGFPSAYLITSMVLAVEQILARDRKFSRGTS